jgi:uncharacterized protein YdaU (DUF1376 family)
VKLRGLWWWIDRWRKSTAYTDMTLEEQGAYRNLLDDAALRGGALPNDEHALAKACGDPRRWRRVRPKVMARFTLQADGWHNATLDEVLRESERRANKQAAYRQRRGPPSGNDVGNVAGNGVGNPWQHTVNLIETDTDPEKVFVRSSEGNPKGEPTPPLDLWLEQLQSDYPQQRVTFSYLTSSAFFEVFQKDSRAPAEVWAQMRTNLENQKRGYEWRVKGMVPKLDKWLRDGCWKQQHDEHPPSTLVTDKTAGTLEAASQILRGKS